MTHIPFLDLLANYDECRQEIDEAYHRVMNSGKWILGPELEQFEAEYAAYCGTRHCIGVGNGLDALYLALKALQIGPGDEVIVPAHTFIATWLAISRTGATPVPVEPYADTFMPDANRIESCITPRTRAVIAVHLYGSIAGIEEITDLCITHNIPLIEDAAQAHGAQSSRARAGNHGIMGCFSFYPSKNLGACGDGGAIVTNDPDMDRTLRTLRNYGSCTRYQHDIEGINSRLDELQAAMLRVQLPLLDMRNERRRILAEQYIECLRDIPGLHLPLQGTRESHVWHLFVLRSTARNALQQHLQHQGCDTLIHYPRPVYRFAPFERFAPAYETRADRLTATILSLPMGPHLSVADVNHICEQLRNFHHPRAVME